ncbi:MAG: glycosyltransferase family 4 protein [Blastocatellia bacterium]
MSKIKVAEILEASTGGTRTHMELLLQHIDRSRFAVTLVCSTRRDPQFAVALRRYQDEGITVQIIEMVRNIHPVQDMVSLWRLYCYFRKCAFHVVHTHSSKAGILGRFAARLAGIPTILHTPHAFAFQDKSNRLAGSLFLLAERLARQWTTALICVSEGERGIAIRSRVVAAANALVIHNSIDLERADGASRRVAEARVIAGCSEEEIVVGTVANLRPQKGLHYFINAARRVLSKRQDVKFVIVGHGSLHQQLNELIVSSHLQERMKIISGETDTWPYYALIDVFVLTSLWEGLPYVMLEAMAMGKPVVASDISGCRDVVIDGKTGLLVQPRDEQAIASAILTLIENPDMRRRMGTLGRRVVEQKYRIQQKIKELEAAYEGLQASSCQQR